MKEHENCLNCSTKLNGNYCSNCGQESEIPKLTIKEIFKDAINDFFYLENSILRTIKQLLANPKSIVHYLDGKRKSLTKPFPFVLLATMIVGIVYSIIPDMMPFFEKSQMVSDNSKDFVDTVMNFTSKNIGLITIGMLPLSAFISWFFYRKSRFNYAEHLVINCYMTSIGTLFLVLFLIPFAIKPNNLTFNLAQYLPMLFNFAFYTFVFISILNQKIWKGIWKNFVIQLVSLSTIILIPSFIYGIYMAAKLNLQ